MAQRIEDQIKDMIIDTLGLKITTDEIGDTESLVERKIVQNSLSMMHLIVDLEMVFEIEVADEDLNLENFGSVEKIAAYIGSAISA